MESSTLTECSETWQPNEELLQMLVGMGISKIAAEHALYYTGNQSAEAAASYVFDNPDVDVMPPLVKPKKVKRKPVQKSEYNTEKSECETESSSEEDDGKLLDSYKMVFIVNNGMKMETGKVVTQVANACLGIYRLLCEFDHMREILEEWENEGEKKVVLKSENHVHLQELETLGKTCQLFSFLLHDGQKAEEVPCTELDIPEVPFNINPIPAAKPKTKLPQQKATVLALFGPCSRVDQVTGELELL